MDKIDTNPNQVTEAPLKTLLPKVQTSLIMNILGGGTPRCIYYVSEQNGYVNGTNILDSPKDIGGSLWQSAYLDLNDLLIIKKNAIQSEAWTYVGIADLLSAINYMILCDNFGDIPYSEAFKSDISNPKFDSAESIYSKIDETIDEAISYFAKPISTIEPKNDDMFYAGDKQLWIKSAYALKARLYNRLANKDPQRYANKALDAIQKSFTSSSEDMIFTKFINSTQNSNPLSAYQLVQPLSSMGSGIYKTMIYFSNQNNVEDDPRTAIWFTRVNGQIIPAPNGTEKPDFGEPRLDGAIYSKPAILKIRTAPMSVLTHTELKFIEAESRLRLGQNEVAYNVYLDAVREALKQASNFNSSVKLSDSAIETYMNLQNVSPGYDKFSSTHLVYQKYIYHYQCQPYEAYNDIRQWDMVPITNPKGRINRLPYPDIELSRNSNAPTDINDYTVFDNNTKLFWAK